ncbi:HAD-IB family hydrolase [Actinomycetaceae bacterium TAE3-ERU4]|nr:HAD-IB family hydrolase [Actinomycetaceae bacterium TAE3-ERU4]
MQQSKQVAAFFDIDQTLIRGASGYHVAKALYKRNFFGKRDILFFTWHALLYHFLGEDRNRIKRIVNRGLKIVNGHNEAELKRVTDEIYDRVFAPRIFAGTYDILKDHLEKGHEVWLISATPELVSSLFARRLGTTGALGTKVKVDGHGNYLPQLDGEIMHRRGKAIAAIKLASSRDLNLAHSYAYGDSINDLPLLQTVGNPTAINPEPLLRLVALKQDWPIRDFRKPRLDLKKLVKRFLQTAFGALLISNLGRRFTRW